MGCTTSRGYHVLLVLGGGGGGITNSGGLNRIVFGLNCFFCIMIEYGRSHFRPDILCVFTFLRFCSCFMGRAQPFIN